MAKKDISSIVRGAGLLTSVWTELMVQVQKRGGNEDDIHRLTRPEGRDTIAKMAELIVDNTAEVFQVVVDYGRMIADMIASGHYDWVNPDITQDHFPPITIGGEGTIELKAELIHFGKTMSTDNVLIDLDRRGYRPATLSELLAFGAKYPEKQREFPVVALGSVWTNSDGNRYVPCLYEDDSERGLSLDWYDVVWDDYRFLAFRK